MFSLSKVTASIKRMQDEEKHLTNLIYEAIGITESRCAELDEDLDSATILEAFQYAIANEHVADAEREIMDRDYKGLILRLCRIRRHFTE